MIYFFIIIVLLSVISLFFKLYLKFKMEEALFITIGFIVFILTIFGFFGLMRIGQYIIYIATILSLCASIYYTIKNHAKINLLEIFTPGYIIILLSFFIFAIMTKNNVLYIWDEATRYGRAAHFMHVTNSVGNGGSVTVFTYFFNTITGYQEHSLFVSKWLFMWICAVLPLAHLKWKKWYMAVIYAVLIFGVLTIIDPETNYLMDAPIGIAAGAGIGYLASTRQKARTVILALACALTSTIKDNAGLILLVFMLLFYFVYYVVELNKSKWKISKKHLINTSLFSIFILIFLIIKKMTVPAGLLSRSDIYIKYLPILVAAGITIAIIGVCWVLWLHKVFAKTAENLKKRANLYKLIKIAVLSLTPFVLFAFIYKVIWKILYSFSVPLQTDFVYALNKYFGYNYFGMPLWTLLLIIMGSALFCILMFVKHDYKKSFTTQVITMVVIVIAYGFIIALLFTTSYHMYLEEQNMLGIERFIGTIVIMLCTWIMSLVFLSNDYWVDSKKQYIISFALFILLIPSFPLPGETMFSSITNINMNANKYTVRPIIKEHSDIINKYTPENARVLVINVDTEENPYQLNISAWRYWLFYETVPRSQPKVLYLSRNDIYVEMSSQQLMEKLKSYHYLYIVYADEEFFKNKEDILDYDVLFETKTLYKKVSSENGLILELVHSE